MEWYFENQGQQNGPVSQSDLEGKINSGELPATTLVWKEGMKNWVKAFETPMLSVDRTTGAMTAPGSPTQSSSIYAAPSSRELQPNEGSNNSLNGVIIKKASFGLVLTLLIGAFILFIGGGGLLTYGEESEDTLFETLGVIFILSALIPFIWGTVLTLMYLYRCWLIVYSSTNGNCRTSPGQAVGFLFIPFFNLYWYFVAYSEWAKTYNFEAARHNWNNRVSEGIFLTYCILNIVCSIPVINYLALPVMLIISPIVLFQICKTINTHANA